jgi:anaerobic selenocysteine-containing dehydrogenase
VPLPTYFPSVLENLPGQYDFYATTYSSMQFAWGQNAEIPLLIEIAEHVPGQGEIMMNTSAARARGITDGDEVWVETEVGRIKQRVRLREGIRPDTIAMCSFGQWATPIIKDKRWANLGTITPIRASWTDPLTGTMQGLLIKAKVYKA